MKSLTLYSALLLIGVSASSLAANVPEMPVVAPVQNNNWYVNVFGGVAFVQCTSLDGFRTEYDVGWDVGGGFGYRSGPMRYEAQYIFQRANIDTIGGESIDGNVKVNAGLFNVLYNFGDVAAVANPYLGAGIGYANTAQTFRESNGEFAYDAKAGLDFNLVDNAVFAVGYQFFGTTHSDTLGGSFLNHMINAGIIYYID